jgi:hypothetical protein
MRTTTVLTAVVMSVALAAQATAADPTKQEPKKRHHKAIGVVMILGGIALGGASAFAFSQPCPAVARAQELFGGVAVGGHCGSSWLQNNKTVIGGSAAGAGAALVISGFVVMHQSAQAEGPKPSLLLAAPKN